MNSEIRALLSDLEVGHVLEVEVSERMAVRTYRIRVTGLGLADELKRLKPRTRTER